MANYKLIPYRISDFVQQRITDKHRLVYRFYEDTVVVLVLSAYGHYGDK